MRASIAYHRAGLALLLAVSCGQAALAGEALRANPAASAVSGAAAPAGFEFPLFFEQNLGQTLSPAGFLARGQGYDFFLSPDAVEFVLWKFTGAEPVHEKPSQASPGRDVEVRAGRLRFLGANSRATMVGENVLQGKINYLVGSDPARWRTGVPTFADVKVPQLYPGIDLVYYGNPRQLEFDFQLGPGADPRVISLGFEGVDRLSITPQGELLLAMGAGELRQPPPLLYQMVAGERQKVPGAYKIVDAHTVAFEVGDYDQRLPLVIDPSFSYSTYFGGNGGDAAYAVKVDTNGAVYIAGATLSTEFRFSVPSSAFQSTYHGGSFLGDAFVAKLDNTGANLLYFTYLGGSGDDSVYDMALDGLGDVFLTGMTASGDFPTKNALYAQNRGPEDPIIHIYPNDVFVAELNPAGSGLVFSTYLGGSDNDVGSGIALDPAGYIYVTGYTSSSNFPYAGGHQNWYAGNDDAFVTRLAPGGTRLVYSTFLGGYAKDRGQGIAADENGFAYVTGYTYSTNFPYLAGYQNWHGGGADAFVTCLKPTGGLSWSTYLGGGYNDFGTRIVVDSSHHSWVTGSTLSPAFPHANAIAGLSIGNNGTNALSHDIFLSQFDSAGRLLTSSIFGGTGDDSAWGLALDPAGRVFIAGSTVSFNFPTTNVFGLFRTNASGFRDAFVVALDTNATQALYSGYLGGIADEFCYGVAADSEGSAYVTGITYSTNFPTASPYQAVLRGPGNAFLAKIRLVDPILAVTPVGSGLVAQWPATAPGYVLQFSPQVAPPVNWSAFEAMPQLSNGVYTAVAPAGTNAMGAFRLARPN